MEDVKTPSVVDSSDQSSMAEPGINCPEYWGENILGFNLCGQRQMNVADNHNPQPEVLGLEDKYHVS